MLWLIVGFLTAGLILVHYRFMSRDQARVLLHWNDVETALKQRTTALKTLTTTPDCPREFAEIIAAELRVLENREDKQLSRLKQRAALESRLSSILQKQLNSGNLSNDLKKTLEDLDTAIQTPLRYYDIAANSYRYHFESAIGKLLSILPNFDKAPAIEIQKLRFGP